LGRKSLFFLGEEERVSSNVSLRTLRGKRKKKGRIDLLKKASSVMKKGRLKKLPINGPERGGGKRDT